MSFLSTLKELRRKATSKAPADSSNAMVAARDALAARNRVAAAVGKSPQNLSGGLLGKSRPDSTLEKQDYDDAINVAGPEPMKKRRHR